MANSVTLAVCSELKGDAAVSAIVAFSVFDSVVPNAAQVKTPYITVQQIPGGEQAHDQSGASGLARVRLQINCYESTAKLAHTLRDAVADALDGNIGATIGTGANTLAMSSLFLIDDFQDFEPALDGSDVPAAYVYRMEFEGWHA